MSALMGQAMGVIWRRAQVWSALLGEVLGAVSRLEWGDDGVPPDCTIFGVLQGSFTECYES